MQLADQVCSPEQAKQLKELGIKQKSLFYFHESMEGKPVFGETLITPKSGGSLFQVCNDKENAMSAFTVAELGVMLPSELLSDNKLTKTLLLQYQKPWSENENWFCGYIEINTDLDSEAWIHTVNNDSEAKCRASMLIYLIENKLVIIEEARVIKSNVVKSNP